MTKKQHYMTRDERLKLEAYRRAGKSVAWIARELGFCRQTIYNELRGEPMSIPVIGGMKSDTQRKRGNSSMSGDSGERDAR